MSNLFELRQEDNEYLFAFGRDDSSKAYAYTCLHTVGMQGWYRVNLMGLTGRRVNINKLSDSHSTP